MWMNVDRIAVICSIRNADKQLQDKVCARLAKLASVRSPYPVVIADATPRDVALRFEGAFRPGASGQGGTVAGNLRATRVAIEHEVDSASASIPITVAVHAGVADSNADAKVAAALDRILPWRGRRRGMVPRTS